MADLGGGTLKWLFSHSQPDKIVWDKSLFDTPINFNNTKTDGIFGKLASKGFQNWYDFISWHSKSPKKLQEKKGKQISRTTFLDDFEIKYYYFSFFG